MTDGKRIGICGRPSEGSFCSCIHCLQTGYSVEPALAHGTCSSFLMLWNLIFSNHHQVPILFIDTMGDITPPWWPWPMLMFILFIVDIFFNLSTFYFLNKFNKLHKELSRAKMTGFCSVPIFLKGFVKGKCFDRFLY